MAFFIKQSPTSRLLGLGAWKVSASEVRSTKANAAPVKDRPDKGGPKLLTSLSDETFRMV